jgi:hypothetical protein
MPTATLNVDRADHELRARQADALWTLTRERHRREIERMERAERLAWAATTDEERRRQTRLAELHQEAAQCHQRGAEFFAAHRDHERRFVERMRSGSAPVAA